MISAMASQRLAVWLHMVCISGAVWSQGVDLNFVQNDGSVHHALMAPHRNPDAIPPGFEIRLNAEESGDSLWLISTVQLPYGGYIISATCTFDYLGGWTRDLGGDGFTVIYHPEDDALRYAG